MMSNVLLEKFGIDSKRRRHTTLKNLRRFPSSKRKSKKSCIENKPLISAETDSCSDEEITLHDIRHIKRQRSSESETSVSNLRKVTKGDNLNTNGAVSGSRDVVDPFQHCDFLNLKIEEGDTLQSISIKYQCAISDIKRANNLINSQDFYALKQLKIPVKKYSLLTEILPIIPNVNKSQNSMTVEENNVRTINIGIGPGGRSPSPEEAAAFFKRMDEDLVKIMLSTQSQKESLEAAAVALTSPQIQPLVKDPYNTVDCGIQWNYLIVCVIIVAIVIPAAIALFMYMRSSQDHHQHHPNVYPSASSNQSFDPVTKSSLKK